jgi:hypothetical protein
MTEAELVAAYPRLWHMAEDGSWPAIRAHGLLSTAALLDLYGIAGAERDALLTRRRPEAVALARPGLPGAMVRDQKPMSDAALLRCLDPGLAPAEWYGLLNGLVFFWPSRRRLLRLVGAYPDRPQTILTVRTASLLAVHRDAVRLSPINSGSTIIKPQPRGRGTFLPIADYPLALWRRRRGLGEAVAEVTVPHAVPDIAAHVVAVHRLAGGVATALWRAPAGGDAGPGDDGPV